MTGFRELKYQNVNIYESEMNGWIDRKMSKEDFKFESSFSVHKVWDQTSGGQDRKLINATSFALAPNL